MTIITTIMIMYTKYFQYKYEHNDNDNNDIMKPTPNNRDHDANSNTYTNRSLSKCITSSNSNWVSSQKLIFILVPQ